jgi:hypothetical protein
VLTGSDHLDWFVPGWRCDKGSGRAALVNNCQIDRTDVGGPLVYGLNAGNRDGVPEVTPFQAGRIQAHGQVRRYGMQLLNRLFEQLPDMRQDEHAPTPGLYGIAADGGDDVGLTRSGGQDGARVVVPRPQVLVNGRDGPPLIRTQLHYDCSVTVTITFPSGTTQPRVISR